MKKEALHTSKPDVNWKKGKLLNRASKKDTDDWVKNSCEIVL